MRRRQAVLLEERRLLRRRQVHALEADPLEHLAALLERQLQVVPHTEAMTLCLSGIRGRGAAVCCAASAGGADGRRRRPAGRRARPVRKSRLSMARTIPRDCSCSARSIQWRRMTSAAGGRRHEVEDGARVVGAVAPRGDAAGKHGERLDLRRQRAHDLDAGERRQLAQLLKPELGAAIGHERADRRTGAAARQCGHGWWPARPSARTSSRDACRSGPVK